MIITHAVVGLGGLAVVLLAAVGLIVVLTLSARAHNLGRRTDPEAVPLWWDQPPASNTPGGLEGSPSGT